LVIEAGREVSEVTPHPRCRSDHLVAIHPTAVAHAPKTSRIRQTWRQV
jgi:hypothetical protein